MTRACLERIERLNPTLNAFITVTDELALQQAVRADQELAAGNRRGPLHGIPIAIKDLIDLADVPTTAASHQLSSNVPAQDAGVVARLKDAGAVIVGKTNLHEFAFGGSGMVSAYGTARNPWDSARITGGSSSGSAAAVASGMCIAALGTDTAGSVRIPAALCGIVGHRPSAGVWSTKGIVPLRRSFDATGPMARTVQDASLMFHALSYTDIRPPSYEPVNHLRIGVARKGFFDGCDSEVAQCIEQALDVLRSLTASVLDVDLEVPIRWTDFDEEILDYHRPMMERSPELYQPATLERLRACANISLADYEQARDSLAATRQNAARTFEAVDVVVTPTCLVAAPEISVLQAMPDSRPARVRSSEAAAQHSPVQPAVLAVGVGALRIHCRRLARRPSNFGPPGADDLALAFAGAYEQATEWHKHVPPLAP